MREIEVRSAKVTGTEREVEVELARGNNAIVVGMTYEELADLHHKATLHLMSVAGQVALRERGIVYRAKVSTEPERHPEWEACKR